MCVYIYVYIYIYICVCVCVCVCLFVYLFSVRNTCYLFLIHYATAFFSHPGSFSSLLATFSA